MVAFFTNTNAQTYSTKHRKAIVTQNKPWARRRNAVMDLSISAQTVAGSAALNTTVGQMSAVGGKAPYTYTMNNSDGGNFSVTSGGLVQTAKAPPMSAPNPGVHNISVSAQDSAANLFVETFGITVT